MMWQQSARKVEMGGTNVVRQAFEMSEEFRKHGYTSQMLQISKRMLTLSLQLQLSSDDV